jgi:hypothetical protein
LEARVVLYVRTYFVIYMAGHDCKELGEKDVRCAMVVQASTGGGGWQWHSHVSVPSKTTSPESDAIKEVIKQRHPRNGARGGALVDWGRSRTVAALLRRHRSKVQPQKRRRRCLLQDAESRRPDEKHFPLL